MRTETLTLVCAALLQLVMAKGHDHLKHHHPKRQEVCSQTVTDVVTDTEYVTYDSEDVTVYVNGANQPVSTTTVYNGFPRTQAPPSSSSPAPPVPSPALPSSSSIVLKPEQMSQIQEQSSALQSTQPLAPSPSKSPQPSPSPGLQDSASSGPGFSSAIAYTPYNADQSCKSASQVAADFQKITGYEVVRLYGTDCDQISNVIAATHSNVKLLLGIFDIDSIQSEVGIISSAVSGRWSIVHSVSVGNELVNTGKASASQVVAAIATAKAALKSVGYSGPITVVDTMMAMKNNIELCTASDFCAINCHAFFDGNTLPENSGTFVKAWVEQISEAAGGKTTIVTESGWPHQGNPNNKAVPSPENQAAAISSLKAAFGGGANLVLYNSYNDLWKSNSASTFGAEQYWGIMGDAPG